MVIITIGITYYFLIVQDNDINRYHGDCSPAGFGYT